MLLINVLVLTGAYFIVSEYMKSAPMKTQIIEGLKYTLIGGYKYTEDKFFFQLTIVNPEKNARILNLNKPFVRFIVEAENQQIFQIAVDTYSMNNCELLADTALSKTTVKPTAFDSVNTAGVADDNAKFAKNDFTSECKSFILNYRGKLEFMVKFDLKEINLQRGKYKLIALINNYERYQVITDFKIGKYKR